MEAMGPEARGTLLTPGSPDIRTQLALLRPTEEAPNGAKKDADAKSDADAKDDACEEAREKAREHPPSAAKPQTSAVSTYECLARECKSLNLHTVCAPL